jgi:arylsulfatase A-like enzyme
MTINMKQNSTIPIVTGAFLALALLNGHAQATEPSALKPNVIFIMADDEGTVDLGCYGSKDLHTPNLDALAARGVRFTQFYSGAPICSPSRACFLTGRYPVHAGLTTNAGEENGLPGSEVTIAEVFKAAGYATAHLGKWHLGLLKEMSPNAQGFNYSFGFMEGCIDSYSHFYYWSGPNRHDLWRNGVEVFEPGRYFPDLMLREATALMEKERAKPFFIYYALNTPHYPYMGEVKWLEHFNNLPYPRNLYAAYLASQDERIGKLLAKVDALGLRERTIVVFQSDNGHSTEERAHFGGGSAGEYRGAKFSFFEGGIRVPAIVSWPGKLQQNETRGQMAHGADWLPTLAELCGVKLPDVKLDGRSLVPVLQSAAAPSPHDALHWQTSDGHTTTWAVREGDWKLISNGLDTSPGVLPPNRIPRFLANLKDDPRERTNLEDQHPEIIQRLTSLHDQILSTK